ncbi:MAG: ABC transporter permease, partial [Ancalomicrobiaceae bacterium]|nr:ABC transporter permease [Ancalomicrobiaceae bacterium]
MMASVLNRLVMAAITLLGVGAIVFVLLRVVPGDPIAMMISPGASPADIAALRARYGLDADLATQFWMWLKAILAGDFGMSISLRRGVLSLLAERLPATLELAFAALMLAVVLGLFLAVLGTLARRSIGEPLIDAANGLALAVPDFVWALALVLVFGVFLPVLPLSGRIDPSI